MSLLRTVRLRLRALFQPDAVDRELNDELHFHIEMQTEANLRAGMPPEEAHRQAMLLFGGVEGHKEAVREGRTLAWLGGLSLDVKLAWRMLMKHSWLSLVGGLGIALGVAIGTIFFGVRDAILNSTLPFDEGERIVALEVWDTEGSAAERRILHEFGLWRRELRSVEALGAWTPASRNLFVPGGGGGPVAVAEMTATGFEVTRVAALLGRTLVAEDELPGAPAVAVIGHDVWRTRFGSDPAVLGREVRLGRSVHTVVGVMPEGFAFPMNQAVWVPLRVDASVVPPRTGRPAFVFGRLAPGATLESARAELAAMSLALAADSPDTHGRLRARIAPYAQQSLTPAVYLGFRAVQTLTLLLLVVVCLNIAVLVHARTAVRQGEIAVRSALGATRRRIVGQLFAEAFALSLMSALVGVTIAALVLAWGDSFVQGAGGDLGFWIHLGLSPGAVLYAMGLAVASALIVGVIPALKVTGSRLRPGLDQGSSGAGLRLGRAWTAQIIGQVAVATAILPAATSGAWDQFRYGFARPEFAAEEFLTAQVELETEAAASTPDVDGEKGRAARFENRVETLVVRLRGEPAVAAVTFARHSVGATLPATVAIDGVLRTSDAPTVHSVRTNEVDPGLFDAFGVPVLHGRGFRASDLAAGTNAVIVNQAFVDEALRGRNAIGSQFRYTWRYGWNGTTPGHAQADLLRRYEIVGVVGNQFLVGTDPGESEARVYHPATAGPLGSVSLAIRMRVGSPADFAPRLRELAAAVDPTLQLHRLDSLDDLLRQEQRLFQVTGGAIAAVTLSVILLSAAGIHALMSLTVLRRRREIGIRTALGARPARLLAGVFSRAAGQIAVGLVSGVAAATLLHSVTRNLTGGQAVFFVSAAAALMSIVGLLSALGPARRGLRVEPMEALRAD